MGDSNETERARELRQQSTDAERLLWRHLRGRQMAGFKFRRQYPLGPYFVDFVSFEKMLIIELDGGQHADQHAYDQQRTAWLEAGGFRVMRFWDNDVLTNLEGVTQTIFGEVDPGERRP